MNPTETKTMKTRITAATIANYSNILDKVLCDTATGRRQFVDAVRVEGVWGYRHGRKFHAFAGYTTERGVRSVSTRKTRTIAIFHAA